MTSNRINRNASIVERAAVVAAMLAILVIPPLTIECFPLSTCSMFAMPYTETRVYALTDSQGRAQSNDMYGLRTNVNWYLEYTYPVKYPPLAVPPTDQAPDIAALIDHIRAVGQKRNASFPMLLQIEVYGDVDGRRVGLKEQQSWRIGPAAGELERVAS